MQLNLALEHRAANDYVITPYNFDRAPLYYVLGGLVFQELSRQYLREWGANWLKDFDWRWNGLYVRKTGAWVPFDHHIIAEVLAWFGFYFGALGVKRHRL